MATYYIRKGGNDSNAGTSAGAAWLTIQKAHNAAAGPTGGDTVYVGAGTYRETVVANMTSATSELKFVADVDGAQTGDAGPVIWTAYTTNDSTIPAAASTLNLNAKDFMTYEGFLIQGGNTSVTCVAATGATSTDITFRRCVFVPAINGGDLFSISNGAGVTMNWQFDSCILMPNNGTAMRLTAAQHSADYDLNIVIKNCIYMGTGYILLGLAGGAGAGFAGGVVFLNNTFYGSANGIVISSANYSTTIPCRVYNCFFSNCSTGMVVTTSGCLVEDYNVIQANTVRTNVTAGANSIATFARAPALDWGYSVLNGFLTRPAFQPRAGSPMLGFGNSGTVTPPTTDILGRPRPAGGASTSNGIGAYELHDTAAKETGTTDAGSIGLSITGPGDHDLLVPVSAVATTFTIRARYDTTHAATNKPQVILQANGEIGVSASTVTMTAAADTWETLTVGPFTPTAKGFVTLRLVSRSAAGGGKAFFDTAVVPDMDTGDFAHFKRGEVFPAIESSGVKVHPGMQGGMRG